MSCGNRQVERSGHIGHPVFVRWQDVASDHRPRSGAIQPTPTQQPRHRLPPEALGALRRIDACAMHGRGALRPAVTGLAEAIHAGHQGGGSGALVVTRHRPTDALRAGHAPSPLHRPLDLCTVLVASAADTLPQHTHDHLAVLRGRVRGVPQGWDVVRQALDRLPLTGRQLRGTLASEPRRRLVQVLCVTARLVPAP